MSYILEALRKSERQRRANDEPPLARLAAEAPRSTRRRSLVITLSVLANIGLLIYLLLPLSSRTGSGDSVGPKTIATESPPGIPQSGQAPVTEATKSPEAGVTPGVPEAAPRTPARPRPSAPAKPAPSARPKKEITRPLPQVEDEDGPEPRFEPAVRTPAPSAQSPPLMAPRRAPAVEIDESEGAGLPRPKISVYAYSNRNDSDRFVIINGRKYREGERIENEGSVVKRIEEHAMTLEYAGRTYKVPRP